VDPDSTNGQGGSGGSSSAAIRGSGTIIGIAVGSTIGVLFALFFIVLYCFYQKKRAASQRRKGHRHIEPLVTTTLSDQQTATAASSRSRLIPHHNQRPSGAMLADTKATRALDQFVTFDADVGSSSRMMRSGIQEGSSQAVESPTDDEVDSYTALADGVSPTSHGGSSEVSRLRGQLSNLMREVARIRDERLPPVIGSSEAPPLYDEEDGLGS